MAVSSKSKNSNIKNKENDSKKKNSININRLMNQQFSKYSSLNIPKNVLLECFNSVKIIQDESEMIFRFDKNKF